MTEVMFCECNNWQCRIQLSIDKAEWLTASVNGQVFIADECLTGAQPTDSYIRSGNGYKVYLYKGKVLPRSR